MDSVIHTVSLEKISEKNFDQDPNGRLLIWEEPDRNCQYVVGVDVATGVGLTNSVAHVLRVGTMYEPFEQVAEFACNFIDPHSFAPILQYIGHYYRSNVDEQDALMAIECNNAGESTQYDLMTIYGYTNLYIWKVYDRAGNVLTNRLGWWTTPRTRRKIVLNGTRLLRTGMWHINSPWFIDEMADFVLLKGIGNAMMDSEMEAAAKHKAGAMDDRLFAGFIAVWCANDLHTGMEDDPVLQHQKWIEREHERALQEAKGEKRQDFQNCDMSYARMREVDE